MHEYLALGLVFLSGVGFSIQGLIQKLLSEDGFHDTFITVLIQGMIQSCCLGVALLFDEERYKPDGRNRYILGENGHTTRILFSRAIFGFGSLAFAFLAFDTIALGDATVLVMLGPLIAAIMSALFLAEPFLRSEMIATALTLTGSILVAKPPFIFHYLHIIQTQAQSQEEHGVSSASSAVHMFGVVSALMASMCAGGSFVLLRVLGTSAKIDFKNICFIQGVVRVVLSIPAVWLICSQHFDFVHYTWLQYGLMVVSGLIATAAQVCMTVGLQQVKSALGSTMRMSDVVLSFVFQLYFTQDPVDWLSVMGAVLVLTGITYMLWHKDQGKDKADSNSSVGVMNNSIGENNESICNSNNVSSGGAQEVELCAIGGSVARTKYTSLPQQEL